MITKRGKAYYLDVTIRGQRFRESLHIRDKYQAYSKANQRRIELEAEIYDRKVKFSDFCEKYLAWAKVNKPASVDREAQRLAHIQTCFSELGVRYLADITPYQIEQLRGRLREGWPERIIRGQKVSQARSTTTINRYSQLLRGMFYRAHDWGLYKGENPLKKIRFYREGQEVKPLTEAQIASMLEIVKDISKNPKSPVQAAIADMTIFALNTGLRRSELLGLKWEQLNRDEITVKGKGGKIRAVPLNETARAVLERQRPRSWDGYIFNIPNRDSLNIMRRTYQLISKRAGARFWFHGLRHYFVTSLVEQGVDFPTIAEIVGHSRLSTSLIYSHTNADRKRAAVAKIETQIKTQTP